MSKSFLKNILVLLLLLVVLPAGTLGVFLLEDHALETDSLLIFLASSLCFQLIITLAGRMRYDWIFRKVEKEFRELEQKREFEALDFADEQKVLEQKKIDKSFVRSSWYLFFLHTLLIAGIIFMLAVMVDERFLYSSPVAIGSFFFVFTYRSLKRWLALNQSLERLIHRPSLKEKKDFSHLPLEQKKHHPNHTQSKYARKKEPPTSDRAQQRDSGAKGAQSERETQGTFGAKRAFVQNPDFAFSNDPVLDPATKSPQENHFSHSTRTEDINFKVDLNSKNHTNKNSANSVNKDSEIDPKERSSTFNASAKEERTDFMNREKQSSFNQSSTQDPILQEQLRARQAQAEEWEKEKNRWAKQVDRWKIESEMREAKRKIAERQWQEQEAEQKRQAAQDAYKKKQSAYNEQYKKRSFEPSLHDDRLRSIHLEMLNCPPDAKPEEIRAAYVKLCFLHHPDRVMSMGDPEKLRQSEEMMKKVNEAWSCLKKKD